MTRRSTLYAVRISPLSWQNPLAIEKGMTDLEHSLEALSSTTERDKNENFMPKASVGRE
jgi:hypothetical protein